MDKINAIVKKLIMNVMIVLPWIWLTTISIN